MTRVLVLVMTALALGSTSCVSGAGFVCELDEQCQGASPGQCEPSGFCSFADPSCDSGRRYGEAAGDLSARCTDLAGPDAANQPDAAPGTPDAPVGEPDAAPNAPDAMPMDDAGPIIVDFVPTNIPSSALTSATNALTLQSGDGEVEINADTGAITRLSDFADLHPLGVGFTRINQPGHPDVGVLSMTGLTIEAGVTVRVVGSAALAMAIKGNATIAGTIDVSAGRGANDAAGPGGYRGGSSSACDGAGAGGGGGGQTGSDVGGGGGGYLASGGAGGGRGSTGGGAAGGAYGAVLIPLVGGSGGGCGGGSSPRARGGGGGGGLQ
ncbi:MAG TPA: hypothetical protein VML75_27700, partial [Kofleriaceae bacterium]|nr:hypothetical protein [Kofleriaceae bacterium]